MKKIVKLQAFLLVLFAVFAVTNVTFAKNGDDDKKSRNLAQISSTLEIEADVFTDITTVKVEMNSRKNVFTTDSKTQADIVADILVKYPTLTKEQIEAVLEIEMEDRASRPEDMKGSNAPVTSILGKPLDRPVNINNSGNNSNRDNSVKREENPGRMKLPAEAIFNRFSGAVKHLEKFISRLETAIDRFEEEGKDTSTANAFLNLAKTDLEQAKEFWDKAKDAYEEGGIGARAEIKLNLDSMREEIRSAFANLKSTLNALKDLRGNNDDDDNNDDSDDEDDNDDSDDN